MPQIKIELSWYGKRPQGAPTETVMSWPNSIDTPEEEEAFLAATYEYLDDEFGKQPKSLKWSLV